MAPVLPPERDCGRVVRVSGTVHPPARWHFTRPLGAGWVLEE